MVFRIATAAAGAALGAGVAAGTALLLYAGPRVLGSAGVLLALALGAVAAGLWAGAPDARPAPSRGRWLGAVLAFLAAALVGGVWGSVAAVHGSPAARSVAALALLAAPAYAVGALLAALRARGPGIGAAAVAGAALGVLAAGSWLIPRLEPGYLYFTCAAVLAAAGWAEARRSAPAPREGATMRGKVVAITGVGGRGQVGYALAEAFLAEGARVLLTDVRADVEAHAAELAGRGEAAAVVADLTRAEQAERLAAAARERFGRLDVLVNAAGGLSVIKPLGETSEEEWAREVDRNARTTFLAMRAALPLLRESRGAIVNFASPAGARAVPRLAAYSAAKAAVIALTRAVAIEEKAHGVRANAVAPGMIDTEQNRGAVPDPESVEWVTREQIAGAVLFLAGEAGAGVSGETIEVLAGGVE